VNNSDNFNFDEYGVRVPAVLVSPWIPPGSKVRPPNRNDATGELSGPPFDHASIIKTLREIFHLGNKLSDRDYVAPSLWPILSLAAPNNDGPLTVAAEFDEPTPTLLTARGAAAPNDMQGSLASAAVTLPTSAPATESELPNSTTPDQRVYPTVAKAQAAASGSIKQFLGLWKA
jgi:phospholipase C